MTINSLKRPPPKTLTATCSGNMTNHTNSASPRDIRGAPGHLASMNRHTPSA